MTTRGVLLETPGAWSEPMHWPLREGEEKLLTLGSNADWSIADGGLLPVHATLYFDGVSLCVAAAPGALLNGQPVGPDWCPVALPAQLALGETRITLAPARPAVEPLVGAPLVGEAARRELQSLNERTTVMQFPGLERLRELARLDRSAQVAADAPPPNDVTQVLEVERVTPTRAFRSPFYDPDETMYALPALSPPMPPAEPPPLEPGAAERAAPLPQVPVAASGPLSAFRSASWPKRLTVLLLPVVIGLYAVKAVRTQQATRVAPQTASAKSATPSAPSGAASLPAPAAASTSAPLPASEGRTAGLTLQRRAVEAFANGDFRAAATLYQRLAAERPNDRAFAVAARVASERAKGAEP